MIELKLTGTKVVQADDGFGGTYPVKVGPRSHVGTTVDEVYALTNEIYSLFDEGLITRAEAELALGLGANS